MGLHVDPRSSAFGQNVRPSDGALLYIYDAGTTTPKATYSDSDETIPQAHPVVADGSGRFPAVYVGPGNYKMILRDKNGVLQYEEDNLTGGLGANAIKWQGDFDSSTNGGDYPSGGNQGDWYRVTEEFVLNAASGSHQLYLGDFIVSNKASPTATGGDWEIVKGRVWLIDEDDFVSDSAILAPSQQSAKAYIGTYVAAQVLDEDDFASDSPTKPPSQQSAGEYIRNGTYTLANKSISSSGNSLAIDTNDSGTELVVDTADTNVSLTIDSGDGNSDIDLDGADANTDIVNAVAKSITETAGAKELKIAVYEIGDWDMQTTSGVQVTLTPALAPDKVISVGAFVRDDDDSTASVFPIGYTAGYPVHGGDVSYLRITGTWAVEVTRRATGFFDTANFSTGASYNRGWVHILYYE
jgi:hypothetical protein